MRGLTIGFMILVAGCSSPPEQQQTETGEEQAAVANPPIASVEEGTPYSAPADPNASYRLISVTPGKGGKIIAMTRRTGSSGTSYSNREIDCRAQLARYIGEGDTLEEAKQPAPNPGGMAPLVTGSSTDAAVQAACANR